MTAAELRNKSHEVNAKSCKAILLMAEEASEKGDYGVVLADDMVPENKRKYLRALGFAVSPFYDNGQKKLLISW